MVVIANRGELAITLLLLPLLSSISCRERSVLLVDSVAFVRPLTATSIKLPVPTQLQQHRFTLETSPLIGGPSWLPLHVKVVLQSKRLYHQWDLVPIDATDTATLQKLVTLQPVPAQIRHRIYRTSSPQNNVDPTSSQHELVCTNIYNGDTLLEASDNVYSEYAVINDTVVPIEQTRSLNIADKDQLQILHAHRFCQSFMVRTNMELHLIWNNCWTFAIQLVFYLLARTYNDTMID